MELAWISRESLEIYEDMSGDKSSGGDATLFITPSNPSRAAGN